MKLRIFLVVASLILSILIGFSIARKTGGSQGAEVKTRPLIGFSMDTLKEARWQKDRDIFIGEAKTMGADVLVQSANSDDTRQMQDVQALISRKIDVLVIIPHNGEAMAKAVSLAHDAGIPVVAYDRLITGCDLDLYLTFDNVKVGAIQAQYLVDHLPQKGKGRIIRLYGAPTDNNAKLFKQGQDSILKPYIDRGDIKVIHEDWVANWDASNAKKIVNAAITRNGRNFDAILASNDGTAGGAVQALMEEGLAGKVLVTGQDAELVACQRIAAGTQAMTVYKPVKALATKAAELAVNMAKGKPIIAREVINNGKIDVPSVLLEVVVVDSKNLKDTVIKDGFQSESEVYGKADTSVVK
ncbi:MAG: sugar ABC transporter substrate-binding protein [Armatimonadota bacterium]